MILHVGRPCHALTIMTLFTHRARYLAVPVCPAPDRFGSIFTRELYWVSETFLCLDNYPKVSEIRCPKSTTVESHQHGLANVA